MGEKIRHFVSRAPRYVLRPSDRTTMRFGLAALKGPAHIEKTILINLSETGAAFVMDPGTNINVGDVIKVEIPIPSGDQIAWFARVVRVEEFNESSWLQLQKPSQIEEKILVGLKFEDLPEPHTRAIRKGVEQSFLKALRDQQVRRLYYYRAYLLQNVFSILGYFLLTIAAIGFIYYFTRPSANYDEKRGAPWGERFKF